MGMSKIQIYVGNSFASLPHTKEVTEMKMNVIKSMEKRHEALLRKGENENEAFGVMVSEFDSTDEIRQELRIPEDQDSPTAASTIGSYPPSTPRELLHGYEAFRGCFAIAITAGVIYHILAVVM